MRWGRSCSAEQGRVVVRSGEQMETGGLGVYEGGEGERVPTVAPVLVHSPTLGEEGLILQVEPAAFKSRGPSELAVAGIAARDSERAERPEREFGETRDERGPRLPVGFAGPLPRDPPISGSRRANQPHTPTHHLLLQAPARLASRGVEQTRSGLVEAIPTPSRPPPPLCPDVPDPAARGTRYLRLSPW